MLAYNATIGLPFVPTYDLHVQAADASELTERRPTSTSAARWSGTVASVDAPRARRRAADRADQPAAVRERQAAAGRHALHRPAEGRDRPQVPADHARATPARASRTARPSRSPSRAPRSTSTRCCRCSRRRRALGVQQSTIGFGEALAGRGSDINSAIGAFLPLLRDLGPVARNLASPNTDLAGFFRGLESYTAALAPVAQTQAQPVRQPRHHVPGAGRRRRAVPAGHDLARRRRRSRPRSTAAR